MAYIIMADDDEIVTDIAFEAFRSYGHILGVVRNGQDALTAVARKKPDLLILDCNMPEMGGLLALREIRKSSGYYDLPVLILTGRQSKEDENLAMYNGASGYLRKPYDPDFLVFRSEEIIEFDKINNAR